MSMVLSRVLAASAIGLLLWLLKKPQPLWLWAYLGSLFLTTPVQAVAGWEFGPHSNAYRWTWIDANGIVLLAIVLVAYEHLRVERYRLRVLAISGLIAYGIAGWAQAGADLDSRLVFSKAFLLLWMAILVGACAGKSLRPDLSHALMAIWMLQALFDFGWLDTFPAWNEASWVAIPAIGILGLLLIGWRLSGTHSYAR